MFTTDLIVLLAMAGLPSPKASSLPPVAAETRLAQAGDWRSNPPPPPLERVRRRRGFVWVEGGYDWRQGRYIRLPGHWERVRAGRQWHGGHWEWQRDHYGWAPGAWSEGPAYDAPPAMVVENPAPPPPPPPVAAPPPSQPRPGFVWIAGAQEWRDGRYVWIEGHWEQERPGDAWRPGHWDADGERHAWHPGGWEHGDRDHDHRDHDHGDHGDHDHGDRDHGDHDHGDHDHVDHGDWHGQERGQEQGQEHGGDPRGGVSIAGQIIDQTGRPAAGIRVVLAGSSEGQAVTDRDGRYAFTGLAPGSYAVRPNDPRCGFRPDVMNLNNLAWAAVQNFSANCR